MSRIFEIDSTYEQPPPTPSYKSQSCSGFREFSPDAISNKTKRVELTSRSLIRLP
jgi:hypothetical protein